MCLLCAFLLSSNLALRLSTRYQNFTNADGEKDTASEMDNPLGLHWPLFSSARDGVDTGDGTGSSGHLLSNTSGRHRRNAECSDGTRSRKNRIEICPVKYVDNNLPLYIGAGPVPACVSPRPVIEALQMQVVCLEVYTYKKLRLKACAGVNETCEESVRVPAGCTAHWLCPQTVDSSAFGR